MSTSAPALTSAPATPTRTPTWPMYRALVSVGLVCGLLISGVYEWTRPIIADKRAAALQRAIFEVVKSAKTSASFALTADGSFVPAAAANDTSRLVHAGYDQTGKLAGLAIEARGMGYQDVITVLYGYDIDQQAIVGMVVLDSRETPGLGDKIATDPDFVRNFEHLDVTLSPTGEGLQHAIIAVKHGEKQHPWEIDAITGATISSNAIASILSESTAFWLTRAAARRADLVSPGGPR